ncbi:MAG: flagellar FliJ family protein [Candidatus Kapabacteria bacterium]|nr:flagellar FliJ family protein [Candidatus Kapabacteria bacterium]MDW7997542.1 flagellar FliJ family protein [Bacteroidota bacterium]MDW8225288.1 flagellar FliJ family protein [Bacteroidota bacterium]
MARFRFPLERLLRLRAQQAQQASYVLNSISTQRQDIETILQRLLHQREAAHDRMGQTGTLLAQQFHDLWSYYQNLQHEFEHYQQRYEQLRELESAQQIHLREALKAEEILQRLRRRLWEAFQAEEHRTEQRQSDEVGQRYHQNPWHGPSP